METGGCGLNGNVFVQQKNRAATKDSEIPLVVEKDLFFAPAEFELDMKPETIK